MTPDPLASARKHLGARDPDAALSALQGADGPDAAWLRALAAAALDDVLRVHVALRAVVRDRGLPDEALGDVARPFAEAVLAERPDAWRPLARAVHAALGGEDAPDDVVLAWELVLAAAEELPQDGHRAAHVLLLASLQRRAGRVDEAVPLARGAQDAARIVHEAEVYHGATLLLAELCWAQGDPELADDVITHGAKQLAAFHSHGAADALRTAWEEARAVL